MKNRFFSLFLILFALSGLNAQVYFLHSDNPEIRWTVSPDQPVEGVSEVDGIVPGTVFSAYVAAGREEDPNFADNIHRVDRNRYDRSFWYRTEFNVPHDFTKERIWLNMNGVNRSATVILNSKTLGFLDGFMQRGRFDITDIVNLQETNRLEILINIPRKPLANQGSPNYLSSGGWDWMPYVPGLNSGLTDKIWLSNTGPCTIIDPWIRTKLPNLGKANLTVTMQVANNSDSQQLTTIRGVIQPGNVSFEKQVSIPAGEMRDITFSPDIFPQLTIHQPKLWWPNGYGDPNLYTCTLTAETEGGVSQEQTVSFGIKQYSYDTDGGIFHIKINGVPVFVKGANWGMSEYMLRCRGDEYKTKICLHRDMNYNMIRNWLGSTTDEEFYEQCDQAGIMVWDDFWINSNHNLPYDLGVFNNNMIEKILRLRNHPCIAVWCGDNEATPEPPLAGWMQENIRTFDGGDRWFQARSNAHNLSGSGYWGAYDERYYFLPYPGWRSEPVMTLGWGFRTEIGTAVVPTLESLRKFIPEDHLWPIDQMWNLHYFGSNAGNAQPDKYVRMCQAYGEITGVEDFCKKAQLVNLQSNRAMYEGWLDHMWDDASGIMNWMGQSAYPSMVWQTYDYYYDLTGAYWGNKYGCEPLHIFWNPATDEIKVANTTATDFRDLTAEATVFNLDGSVAQQLSQSCTLNSSSNTTTRCFTLDFNHTRRQLSLGCKATASSTNYGEPDFVCDGKDDTRWSARKDDNEWISIDLGEPQEIGQIRIFFEAAFGRAYRIQVSDDAQQWNEIVREDDGHEGIKIYTFPEVRARYVRFLGIEVGWWFGYSLWDFSVWGPMQPTDNLSDVHFLRLVLKDRDGKVISQNQYWRAQNHGDYSAFGKLTPANLKYSSRFALKGDTATITAKISLPKNAKTVAVATHVYARNKLTGERLLPAVQNQDYFCLFPGETQVVTISFPASLLQGGDYKLEVEPYNH